MAYIYRGRGPRTRGGRSRGENKGNVAPGYSRRDGNIFSCLSGHTQDGDDMTQQNFSDSDTCEEMHSDSSGHSESLFQTVQGKKKRKLNSSSGGGAKYIEENADIDYSTLPADEKLNIILSKLNVNEARFNNLEQKFDKICKQQKHISKLDSVVLSYEERIKMLEYKSIDLEARSRRNNLLFHGLMEARNEDCRALVCQFIGDQFDIIVDELEVSRAHRIGRYNRNRPRPIIAVFQQYTLTESIIKKGSMLRDSNFSVSKDYPAEITRARRTLWPSYKQLKQQNPGAKVTIVYPAKLIMNGTVVNDLFPEWDSIMRGSRIDLNHPSQQNYLRASNSNFGSSTRFIEAFQSTPISNTASASRSDKNETLMNNKHSSTHSESMQRQSDPPKNLGVDTTTISVGGDRNRADEFKTPKTTRSSSQPRSRPRARSMSNSRTGTKTRSASIVTTAKKQDTPQNPTVAKDTA